MWGNNEDLQPSRPVRKFELYNEVTIIGVSFAKS